MGIPGFESQATKAVCQKKILFYIQNFAIDPNNFFLGFAQVCPVNIKIVLAHLKPRAKKQTIFPQTFLPGALSQL